MFVALPPREDPSAHDGVLVVLVGEPAIGSLAGLSGTEGPSCRHSCLYAMQLQGCLQVYLACCIVCLWQCVPQRCDSGHRLRLTTEGQPQTGEGLIFASLSPRYQGASTANVDAENAQVQPELAADALDFGARGAGRSSAERLAEDGLDLQGHKAGEWLLAHLAGCQPAQSAMAEDLRLQELLVAGWLLAHLAGCQQAQLALAEELRRLAC